MHKHKLTLIDVCLSEVLDASARNGLESQVPIAGRSDPVDQVLWGRVLIFCTQVISGHLSDRIHPHLKEKRTNSSPPTQSWLWALCEKMKEKLNKFTGVFKEPSGFYLHVYLCVTYMPGVNDLD